MSSSSIRRSWIALVFLTLGALQPAQAQVSDLGVRLHAGMAMPAGGFSDFYDAGVAVGLDATYPIRDRLDLVADVAFDFMNGNPSTYVPDTNLWKFQVGVEADLLGDRTATIRLRPFVSAGVVSFRTKEFAIEDSPPPPDRSNWSIEDRLTYPGYLTRVSKIYMTGTGGLRLGVDDGQGVAWWMSGAFDWTPVGEAEVEAIRAVPLGTELSPFSSATNVIITLGVSLRR